MANKGKDKPLGPLAYENWKFCEANEPHVYGEEYPLYSDTHITGEEDQRLGPYKIFNGFVDPRGEAEAALFLRINYYSQDPAAPHRMDKTDVSRFHGGTSADEIAALLSLECGIRLLPGTCVRRFDPLRPDLLGHPQAEAATGKPFLPRGVSEHRLTPRSIALTCDLLAGYPLLAPNIAVTLVRAARLYRDAIWIAGSDPNLSWIMLASAAETVAGAD